MCVRGFRVQASFRAGFSVGFGASGGLGLRLRWRSGVCWGGLGVGWGQCWLKLVDFRVGLDWFRVGSSRA